MTTLNYPRERITAAVLAGGRATRMGGEDKGLIELNGQPMIAYILAALHEQVDQIIINANRNEARYHEFGYGVIPDSLNDYQGPLAGMASALEQLETPLLLTVPCDGPLIPADLAARLYQVMQAEGAELVVACDHERMQPVFALLKRELLASLQAFLQSGERKIDRWYKQHRLAQADFSDRPETFLNINTPAEREALAARLAE